jgi:hypothetical protein
MLGMRIIHLSQLRKFLVCFCEQKKKLKNNNVNFMTVSRLAWAVSALVGDMQSSMPPAQVQHVGQVLQQLQARDVTTSAAASTYACRQY